jgi:acetoacetate decarboxylase
MMKKEDIIKTHVMPAFSPSYPVGTYYFKQREYLIVTYESDPDVVRAALTGTIHRELFRLKINRAAV